MPNFELIHLGGELGVTGSCHLLLTEGIKILVDCGTAQGADRLFRPRRPGGLLAWVEAMKQRPWRIKLVHGEKKAQQAQAEVLEGGAFGWLEFFRSPIDAYRCEFW